jgi:hypothetical protein
LPKPAPSLSLTEKHDKLTTQRKSAAPLVAFCLFSFCCLKEIRKSAYQNCQKKHSLPRQNPPSAADNSRFFRSKPRKQERKQSQRCAISRILISASPGLSADDSHIAVLKTAFEAFSGDFWASRR